MTNGLYLPVIVLLLAAVAFAADAAVAGLVVGEVLFPAQTRPSKNAIYECGLESEGRCLDPVQAGLLPLRNHLSGFRCGSRLSAAVCCGVYRLFSGRVHRHAGLPAAAGGRSGLGLSEERPGLDINACSEHERCTWHRAAVRTNSDTQGFLGWMNS